MKRLDSLYNLDTESIDVNLYIQFNQWWVDQKASKQLAEILKICQIVKVLSKLDNIKLASSIYCQNEYAYCPTTEQLKTCLAEKLSQNRRSSKVVFCHGHESKLWIKIYSNSFIIKSYIYKEYNLMI